MMDKIWNILLTVAIGAVALLISNAAGEVKELSTRMAEVDRRVTIIESSRFTTADGMEIQKQLSAIRESLAILTTKQEYRGGVYSPRAAEQQK